MTTPKRKSSSPIFAVLVATVSVVAACSTSNPHGPSVGDASDDGLVSCANDPGLDPALPAGTPAALPLMKPGESPTPDGGAGALSFVLTQMDPDPAAEFANTWTMKLLDSTGKPVAGAKLSFPGPPNRPAVAFTPWMPKMGHPASLQVSPQDNGDGTYTLTNLDFTMAGIWQLIVQATWGSVTERATFTFCVP